MLRCFAYQRVTQVYIHQADFLLLGALPIIALGWQHDLLLIYVTAFKTKCPPSTHFRGRGKVGFDFMH